MIQEQDVLLRDISLNTGLDEEELKLILHNCIAKVYGGINSAVVLENGGVLIAKAKRGSKFFQINHYKVSASKYNEILKLFRAEIDKKIATEDIEYFYKKHKHSIFNARINKTSTGSKTLDLEYSGGTIKRAKIVMRNQDGFGNEVNIKGGVFQVIFKSYNSKTKTIYVTRQNKKLISYVCFKAIRNINTKYCKKHNITNINVISDSSKNRLKAFIKFDSTPSAFILSEYVKNIRYYIPNINIIF